MEVKKNTRRWHIPGAFPVAKKFATFFERYCYLLVLLALMPGFIISSPKYAVNAFRVVALAPFMFYCLTLPRSLSELRSNITARFFAFFCLYSLASLLWGAGNIATENILLKILSTCALMMMLYISIKNRSHFLDVLKNGYLFGGTICLLLAYVMPDWNFSFENITAGYGFFNFHVYISWLIGCLGLLLISDKNKLGYFDCLLLILFFSSIILSGGRGGLIVFVCGFLVMLFRQYHPIRTHQVIFCFMVSMILIALFKPQAFAFFVSKGMNHRTAIWHNAYLKTTSDMMTIIFGYGLNTEAKNVVSPYFTAPHYHSIYWAMFYNGGIILLSTYILMLASAIRDGLKYLYSEPWPYIVIGMSAALFFDGNHFFVYPSVFATCFLIPFFITMLHPRITTG